MPDRVLRWAIRRMCQQRLAHDVPEDPALAQARTEAFLAAARQAPIALVPALANAQHYEVPAAFFELVLLANLDRNEDRVLALMSSTYGADQARVWRQRWRMFFMACAELFGYEGGRQWFVSHYRMAAR